MHNRRSRSIFAQRFAVIQGWWEGTGPRSHPVASQMFDGNMKWSLRISHTNPMALKIGSALPDGGPGLLQQVQGLPSQGLSLSSLFLDVQAAVLQDNPRARILKQGATGKSPARVYCHKMTKLPSAPPGLVTVESCLSDMNCNPKVITQVQGRDEG